MSTRQRRTCVSGVVKARRGASGVHAGRSGACAYFFPSCRLIAGARLSHPAPAALKRRSERSLLTSFAVTPPALNRKSNEAAGTTSRATSVNRGGEDRRMRRCASVCRRGDAARSSSRSSR
eukprot:30937-Pelagococcus_subviridis.AAC.14